VDAADVFHLRPYHKALPIWRGECKGAGFNDPCDLAITVPGHDKVVEVIIESH
jgi:hypothetical protein